MKEGKKGTYQREKSLATASEKETVCVSTDPPWGVLRPCVPMIHVAAKWTHAFNQDRVLVQSSLQKVSGQGVRTHPLMVLSAMVREIKQLTFY